MLVLAWKRRSLLEPRIRSIQEGSGRVGSPAASRILKGMALEEAGRDSEAESLYEELFMEEPRDPESSARLSGMLALRPALLAKRLEEESARHSRDGKGEGPGRHLLLAELLLAAGREKGAVDEMRETAALFPDREEVLLSLASILGVAAGPSAEISGNLDRALELAPGSPWSHLAKGVALLQEGEFDGAVQEGERVVSLAPDLAEGHQLLGVARRQAGDLPGALQELRRALLMDPADSPGVVRFQMALTLSALGEHRAAEAALEGDTPQLPDLTYRLAWSFVRRTFLDRDFRGQDWLAWRDRSPGPAASPGETCATVAEMLASLRDPYTRLRGVDETAAIYLRARSPDLEKEASGSPARSSASVTTRDLGGNLGYIRLTNLSDPSAREAVRKALDKMALRDGLVLDLRGNPGGLSSEADEIAGMLLEPGEDLGREKTRFGEQVQRSPQTRPAFSRKPLVILTDRRTGSAAEKLAAGLQGAGRATVVGEETFGKGAGQMSRLLPGGEMVLVTATANLTRQGRALQGRGVVPDVPASDDTSIEKAKELLQKPTP
jgi:tetratricopeptide (TPR) repeat protein